MNALRMGLAGAALALLAGCISLGGGKAPANLLTLSAEQGASAGELAQGNIENAVMVMEPQADRRLAVMRIPVQLDETHIAYLQDAQWIDRPTRLFRSLLAETLRARGKRVVIEDDQPSAPAGLRLAGRLVDLGYDARTKAVVVRFDALHADDKGVVVTRRFEAQVSGVNPKPEAVGQALNKAANEVAVQVAEWMGG